MSFLSWHPRGAQAGVEQRVVTLLSAFALFFRISLSPPHPPS